MYFDLITADRAARVRTELLREINYELEVLTNYQLKQIKNYIESKYHL